MKRRATFKFFRSFYEAAKQLPSKEQQADFFLAVCAYALDGEEPDIQGVPAALFLLVKPNLDTSLKMSSGGARGGQASRKPDASPDEASDKPDISHSKQEEGSRKKEVGSTPHTPQRGAEFDRFWSAYPKKVGKEPARKAFDKALGIAAIESLLTAIERQKCSSQWSRDNGQYIPNPATWLNQRRWEDEITDSSPDKPRGEDDGYGPLLV